MFERSGPEPLVLPLAAGLGDAELLQAAASTAITPTAASVRLSFIRCSSLWQAVADGSGPRRPRLLLWCSSRRSPARARAGRSHLLPISPTGLSDVRDLRETHRSVLVEREGGGLRDPEGLDAVAGRAWARLLAAGDA